ncbi:MAG TPA: carbamoyltransferase HypF [Kofleriaceae bacterium]|nr:carbamoyltransferase HypF [Kofleriaceae bacterium]
MRRGSGLAAGAAVDLERRAVRVRGVVQGVGFRPAMFRLADALGLAGFVCNDRDGVWIEVQGPSAEVARFVDGVEGAAPVTARIEAIEAAAIAVRDDRGFRIVDSPAADARPRLAEIPADLAPCADCLRELTDPTDRRHRYPFTNCTACGPRYTIVRELPYDRASTTMAPFVMCAACRREYDDPRDRRFHAEPNACPACGPTAELITATGEVIARGDAAVRAAAAALADGAIVAVKGAGGFALAVDATIEAAVARLRRRKRRPHKPFAVMVRDAGLAAELVVLDEAARRLLVAPARSIVLAPARGGELAPSVAPGLTDLGVYLPPTPLQHLLLRDGPAVQVMTSGNLADEPIACRNAEARARLATVADVFLVHDREICARADDSVVRAAAPAVIPIRRARGVVPAAIALPVAGPPVLAVGGHERNTVCLAHAGRAVLSPHLGDLDHPDAVAAFADAIARLEALLGVRPQVVVHDRHPDYRSTRWALASGLPCVAVQHHHAHVAACLAEHGRSERVTGIAFDGTGLGDDGTLWGGEILDADLAGAARVASLRPLALVGGEAAIRAPWRLAAAALRDAGESLDLLRDVAPAERARVAALLATDLPPRAHGAGRWFDAVAALLGIGGAVSYDGQAAAQLEAVAGPADAAPFELALSPTWPGELDLRPAIRELVRELRRGTAAAVLAARFHATMARAIVLACRRAGRSTVVLTGGCFQNRRLLAGAVAGLTADGFEVLTHQQVPPNDGGLALGQAAIASARLATGATPCA